MLLDAHVLGNLSGSACPRCGAVGNFTGHGRYFRYLVLVGSCERLTVRRVRCASCGATHAVLPEGVVPYRAYAESFAIAVLAAWASGASNREVRERFGIRESTRRRIVSSTRRRVCALLACGASRAAVDAAVAAAGAGSIPAMHMSAFGTRLAQHVRLINPRGRAGAGAGRST